MVFLDETEKRIVHISWSDSLVFSYLSRAALLL